MIFIQCKVCCVNLRTLARCSAVPVNFAAQLAIQIKQTKEEKRSASDHREGVSDLLV